MSLRALAMDLSESLAMPEAVSADRRRGWRLLEGSRRMILKLGGGALDAADTMVGWLGAGEDLDDRSAEETDASGAGWCLTMAEGLWSAR